MNKLRFIKIIVFLLTFLLVFGLLAMLGLLFQKTKRLQNNQEQTISLNEPVGSTITQTNQQNNILYLTIKDGGLGERIIVFDTNSNKVLSKIHLN